MNYTDGKTPRPRRTEIALYVDCKSERTVKRVKGNRIQKTAATNCCGRF